MAEREFAAGDRVVCLRNSTVPRRQERHHRHRRAGRPRSERTLAIATDRGPTVELSRRYLEAGQRPPRLRAHRPRGPGAHRRARLRPRRRRGTAAGVGLRRALPRPRRRPASTSPASRASTRATSTILDDRDPLTRFGRALEESAIELLAVDQRPLPSGPRHEARPQIERTALTPEEQLHLRLLEQKRRALAKTRDTAERKLATAQRELGRCSPLRRRRRDELRADIELQRSASRLADERLAEARLLARGRQAPVPHGRPRVGKRLSDRSGADEIPRGDAHPGKHLHSSSSDDAGRSGLAQPTAVSSSSTGSRATGAAIQTSGRSGSTCPSNAKTRRLAARRSGSVARSGSLGWSRTSKPTVKSHCTGRSKLTRRSRRQ